tara:strand:+ start:172 stop:387 length:216 start_codon:yes stop_codon:yes gene_type:complete
VESFFNGLNAKWKMGLLGGKEFFAIKEALSMVHVRPVLRRPVMGQMMTVIISLMKVALLVVVHAATDGAFV